MRLFNPPIGISDYTLITGLINFDKIMFDKRDSKITRIFRETDFKKLSKFLNTKLSILNSSCTIEEYWNNFSEIINECIETFIPLFKQTYQKSICLNIY